MRPHTRSVLTPLMRECGLSEAGLDRVCVKRVQLGHMKNFVVLGNMGRQMFPNLCSLLLVSLLLKTQLMLSEIHRGVSMRSYNPMSFAKRTALCAVKALFWRIHSRLAGISKD